MLPLHYPLKYDLKHPEYVLIYFYLKTTNKINNVLIQYTKFICI